jgi:hypothetical protein
MGAVFSVDECYNSLQDSRQLANELAGWRSRGNPKRGVSAMEALFSVRWSVPRLYNASPLVACRSVKSRETYSTEERKVHSAWGYNRATLFLGDINRGTWSQIWDSKIYCTLYIVKDRPVLSSERAPHIKNPQSSDSNKNLVVSPRWVLCSRTEWPTDRRP